MKKIIIAVFIFSNLLFAGINNNNVIDYSEFDKISSHELIRVMSNEIAKNLPIHIDYLTKMINIFGIGNNVVVKKEINIEHKDISDMWTNKKNQLIEAMFKLDSQNICHEPIWEYLVMKRDVIAEFKYVDTNSKPLFNYTVEKVDCQKIIK